VSELLDVFLIEQTPRLARSTVMSWRSMIKERLKPGIGHYFVRDLTSSQISAWLKSDEMKDVTLKFARNCITPLRRALYKAVHDGYRTDNPAAPQSLSVKECIDKAQWKSGWIPDPLNQEEIDALLAACEFPATRNFFTVAFETGLRTGEMIALKWKNIDFDKRQLTVERAIVEGYEKSTKTLAGRRTVELSDEAIEALRDQLDLTKHRVRVFCHPKTLLAFKNSREIYAIWQPAVRRAEIRYRCPRQTRHTYASRLISLKGANLFWLSKQMGHVGTEMINQHYGRWIEGNPHYPNGSIEQQ
jgi:integrase